MLLYGTVYDRMIEEMNNVKSKVQTLFTNHLQLAEKICRHMGKSF